MPKVSSYGGITPVLADLLYVVDDPGGTPISNKVTFQDLLTLLEAAVSTITNKTLGDDLLPSVDNTHDLGSVGATFAEGHFDSIFVGGSEFDGTALADPGADRLAFWDDSASTMAWLSFLGLSITATTISVDKEVGWTVFASDAAVTTGDGTSGICIPASMDGMDLVNVTVAVDDKGVTGQTDVQIRRRRAGSEVDMLSTKITLENEFFASDEVVDGANDDVNQGDILYCDVDTIHSGTAPNGLSVVLEFRKP